MTVGRTMAAAIIWSTLVLRAAPALGDGCVRRFDVVTTGLPTACVFVGEMLSLGDGPVIATFAGDGAVLVVSLVVGDGATQLFFPARVTTHSTADLVRWQTDLDLARADARGAMHLDPSGERLSVRFAARSAEHLPDEFRGRFVGMASVPAPAETAAR